jgi:hypothetical protein
MPLAAPGNQPLMIYLLAIFCSPLALLFAGKPISALFNLVLYVLSIAFWLTIILHTLGFALWALGFLHAVMAISDTRADRRARRVIAATRTRES